MSDFTPSFLTGSAANFGQLETDIASLAARPDNNSYTASVLSSASATPVSAVSKTVAMETDDLALVVAKFHFSTSDGSSTSLFYGIYAAGSPLGSTYIDTQIVSATDGIRASRMLFQYHEDNSGSIAFELKFARNSGSGTVYVGNSWIDVILLKKGA